MANKVIFMDGISKADLRPDGSVRIEVAASANIYAIGQSLSQIPPAIRRAAPHREPAPQAEVEGRRANGPLSIPTAGAGPAPGL